MSEDIRQIQSLIDQVESAGLLDSRYRDMKCINFSSTKGRRGVLSLVFRAWDVIEEEHVAIKFMDPSYLSKEYRLEAFKREPKIIAMLDSARRCLKLRSGLKNFSWAIMADGTVLHEFELQYFVVDWIDGDIDDYFNYQDSIDATLKLEVFKLACLATAAIHRKEVHHRDIKADNFRQCPTTSDVSLIDFGTAARFDSPLIDEEYPAMSVGAGAYSAPEALAGLKSCRGIGHKTDIYALGSMLYELFNQELFYSAQNRNPYFARAFILMSVELANGKNEEEKLEIWRRTIAPLRHTLEPVSITSTDGNSVPGSVRQLLRRLAASMTMFDFDLRESDFERIVRQIDRCIRVLQHTALEQRRRDRKLIFSMNREEKLRLRKKKLNEYLNSKDVDRVIS